MMIFRNKRIIQIVTILFMISIILSGCNLQTHTEMKADYHTDTKVTDKYFDNLNITRSEYEAVYPSEYLGKIEIGSMGPSEPIYHGVIFISDMEAERLMQDYEWEKDTSAPPDLGEVNKSVTWGGDWYTSKAFNQDVFKQGHDEDIRFNGKDTIIFSFGTY